MLNDVTVIKTGEKEIFLIGTAHVSKESISLVKETIEKEKPDVVAIELCDQRYESIRNKKKWDETDISKVIRTGRTHLFLMQLMLANFQRKIGDEIGVKPGSEMIEAIGIAKENNIDIALVDRDIKITLKRALTCMSLKEKIGLLYGFLSGAIEEEEINEELIEKLKDKDVLSEMMEELGREIPSIKKALVDERDTYIANKISSLNEKRIVAVVGAGHVEGIKKLLDLGTVPGTGKKKTRDEIKKEIECLEETKKGNSKFKYVAYLVPLVFLTIVGWGFYAHGTDMTLDLLWKWFLINGTLSALGVMLALGHPLSIIGAFVAAPFTSLNPTIAAGWFAGIIEAWVRKPKVKDFEGLLRLNEMKDYWRNGVTRILLVIILANLGSSLGTFIALPYLASLLKF